MRRVDLPEIEDRTWCPEWLRNVMTGYLQCVIEMTGPYAVAGPALASLLEGAASPRVLDLASGAGGPWRQLVPALRELGVDPQVTLTDLAPNATSAKAYDGDPGIEYHRESVSALDVPRSLPGVRTLFTGLHHFDNGQVRAILSAAQKDGVGFAAFEATHRSWRGILVTMLIPLFVLLMMPRVRPWRVEEVAVPGAPIPVLQLLGSPDEPSDP